MQKSYKLCTIKILTFLITVVSMSFAFIVIVSFEAKEVDSYEIFNTTSYDIVIQDIQYILLSAEPLEFDDKYDIIRTDNLVNNTISFPTEEKEDIIQNNQAQTTEDPSVQNKKITAHTANSNILGANLNRYVLDVIKTYQIGGGRYPYLLNQDYANYSGVTENIYFGGEIISRAHPSGNKYSHCSGITFEVFYKAMQNRNKALGIELENFNGMNAQDIFNFRQLWYVASGPKAQSNITIAVERYGIGRKITTFEEALPGDFIDFSRENHTGHTAIFMNWIRKDNKIIGFRYWSSQRSTGGINYNEEYFNILDENGKKYGNVMVDWMLIARVSSPTEYRDFR